MLKKNQKNVDVEREKVDVQKEIHEKQRMSMS
jgi:hypothetical protein